MKQESVEEQPEKKPIITRGYYIDFAPRRRKPAQPRPRPQPQPQPQPSAEPRQEEIITETTVEEIEEIEDFDYGIIEEYHSVSETTVAKPVSTEEQPISEPEAPDNNRYLLGGRSPFLKSVTVEKRPLSNNIPAKNVYTKPVIEPPKPPLATVVKPESKKSKVPLALLVIVTIIVGAAVGAGAYFFFFQGQ